MKTVEFLDDVKNKLLNEMSLFREEKYNSLFEFNKFATNQEILKCRIIISKLIQKFPNELKIYEEIINSRTVREFLEAVSFSCEYGRYDENLRIAEMFNHYANYLEDSLYEIEVFKVDTYIPSQLTLEAIRDTLELCDKNIIDKDYARCYY